MKKLLVFLCVTLWFFGFAGMTNADLIDRGGGLIYDSDQDITWLQDANYSAGSIYDDGTNTTDGRMTWDNAVAWTDNLVYGGFDDWRLPASVEGLAGYGVDGTTTIGFNITSSEMGYMYYVNLGNLSSWNTDGTPQSGWGLQNRGPFINLQPYTTGVYWSGTEGPGNPEDFAFNFFFGDGRQNVSNKGVQGFAWAVRDGDVAPVPEPATMLLLGTGLTGLVGLRRKMT